MKTNWLMMKSAILMALFGVIAVFLPQELVVYFGSKPDTFVVIIVQIAGALYLGFAFLNYYGRCTNVYCICIVVWIRNVLKPS